MSLRILYINYGSQSGVTDAVLQRLRRAGHEVRIYDPVAGFLYKRHIGSIKVPNFRVDPVVATAAAMARFRRHWKAWYVHTTVAFDRLTARCDRAVAAETPDVVLQSGVLFAPVSDLEHGRHHPPYYLYCDHTRALNERYDPLPGIDPPIPFEEGWRRREVLVYQRADAIFVMSENVRRSLLADYAVPPEKVHIVGAGANVEPQAAPARPREKAFLFVGRNFVAKGGPETLDAFASVRARHADAELWMVGARQPARSPAGVRLLGLRAPGELASLYARAAVFVLPTLREAFGLSFLEAMSHGLPCIGTRIEAIPEIVAEGETGLLVPVRDREALAAAMLSLIGDPARARAMGDAGQRRAAEHFGWDRAVRLMLDVIERRAAERASGSPAAAGGL